MKIFKRMSILICMALSLGVLSSCSIGKSEDNESQASQREMITITHKNGQTEVPKNPKNVVVFDYGALDILDNLGVEVAGLPKAALTTTLDKYNDDKYVDLGGLKEPDFEAVNAINPELIILGNRQADLYDKFKEIGPTIMLSVDGSKYMEDFENNATILGTIFGKEDIVKEKLDEIKNKVAETNEIVAPKNLTALTLMVNEGSISSNGEQSRFGIIYNDIGFVPADKELEVSTHGQQVSFEYIVDKNPDYIFVIDKGSAIKTTSTAQTVLDNDLIKSTDAYKNDRIVYLNSEVWYLVTGGITSTNTMVDEIKQAVENDKNL